MFIECLTNIRNNILGKIGQRKTDWYEWDYIESLINYPVLERWNYLIIILKFSHSFFGGKKGKIKNKIDWMHTFQYEQYSIILFGDILEYLWLKRIH